MYIMSSSPSNSVGSFFEFLEQATKIPAKKPCFLLGNGISRYMNTAPSWTEMLNELAKKCAAKNNGADIILPNLTESPLGKAGMNNPECYTALLVQLNHKKSCDTLKKELKNLLGRPGDCGMLNYIRKKELQVMDTNYDDGLERSLGLRPAKIPKGGYYSHARGDFNSENYPFHEYIAAKISDDLPLEPVANATKKAKESVTDHCAVWHVHGNLVHSGTILLGYEDYISAIIYVRERVLKNASAANGFAEPWEEDFKGKNTWLRLFFTRPLVIAGCGLASEELFLRWLLLRRCRHMLEEKLEKEIPVYYLATPPKPEEESAYQNKKLFFEQLGIQVVEFDDYASLYDAREWEEVSR